MSNNLGQGDSDGERSNEQGLGQALPLLPLSVAIITKDEEANLPRLLDSLQPLKPTEIIIVDSGSNDQTVDIGKRYGAQITETDWPGHVEQKNRALLASTQPWVLSLDADEPISAELAAELRELLGQAEPQKDGYEIKRLTWYLGDWVWHAWYPEWRLRLVRREKAQWVGNNPHDHLEVTGTTGRVDADIYHYSYKDVEDHFRRSVDYAKTGAQELYNRNKQFRWYKIVLSPVMRFIRLMIFRQGWRDGWRGWIIAWSSMFSAFLKYAFLYELHRQPQRIETGDDENKDSES